MMKRITLILLTIIAVIGSLSFTLMSLPNPEQMITGSWMEVSWGYEQAYHQPGSHQFAQAEAEEIKKLTGCDLVMHEAEEWTFYPDNTLVLAGKGMQKKVKWRIKGRGDILEIIYAPGKRERYSISELGSQNLVLNADTKAKVKGIAKLEFRRN